MNEYIEELGKIEDVFFGIEDHGIMTLSVDIAFEGTRQSFGHVCFDKKDSKSNKRFGTSYAIPYMRKLLETMGVRETKKLIGQPLYVLRKTNYGLIVGIRCPKVLGGNGETFIFEDFIKEYGGTTDAV